MRIKNQYDLHKVFLFLAALCLFFGIETSRARGDADKMKLLLRERRDELNEVTTEANDLHFGSGHINLLDAFSRFLNGSAQVIDGPAQPRQMQVGAITKGVPLSVTLDELTLRVAGVSGENIKVKKTTNLGYGTLAFPPKLPTGPGHDLTLFVGDTVTVHAQGFISNHGNRQLSLQLYLFRIRKTKTAFVPLVPNGEARPNSTVTINPGKGVPFAAMVSDTITASGAPQDRKYMTYYSLQICGARQDLEVLNTIVDPWYVMAQKARPPMRNGTQ